MKRKRIIACLIDFIIIIFLVNILGYVVEGDIVFSKYFWNIMIVLLFIYILLKDIMFRNQSIGKKMMNISIKNMDNTLPKISVIVLRNLTLVLWSIEGIVLLISNKRIGDILLKTKVSEI